MPRSLRVDQEYIGTVKAAVRRNGFHSQRELAETLELALATVNNFLNGKPVDRAIFGEICTNLSLDWKTIVASEDEPVAPSPTRSSPVPGSTSTLSGTRQDWGDAPDISVFYGRRAELTTLVQWVVQDRCRLIGILGMGGMGKTSLAVQLAKQLMGSQEPQMLPVDSLPSLSQFPGKSDFEYVIWRSLLNAPPVEAILRELIQFLSDQEEIHLPDTLEGQLSRLMQYLRQRRCLIVLDNFESVLQDGTSAGHYSPGYEGYGRLLQRVESGGHQSSMVITSREKPSEIAIAEGIDVPVRSLQLQGLTQTEGWNIFKAKGCYGADAHQLQTVFEHYAGNPLALRIVASAVQELAGGDMVELLPYLGQREFQFGDINDLLKHQVERLSVAEQGVMYWLALNRDPMTLAALEADIVTEKGKRHLLEAVQSLIRRCLVERNDKQLSLQPVVMEYMVHRLVTRVSNEIIQKQRIFLRHYALIKAQSKDYIRQAQSRLILQPVIDELLTVLGSLPAIEQRLKEMLVQLQQDAPLQPGYVGGNLLNLLGELQADLRHLDCSYLTIWQADLTDRILHGVNFSHADLSKSVFTDMLSATLAVAFSPNGEWFAAGNADGGIHIWRSEDAQKHLTLTGHRSWVTSIAFSPDGQTLVSGSFDCSIRIWNLVTGECLKTLSGHASWIWSVCFSPDGQQLASGSDDCTVRLWNARSGKCLRTFSAHSSTVWSVAFSSDGQHLATGAGGNDRTIRLWDIPSGQVLQQFEGHTGWVRSVVFSPDGQTLISGSADATAKIWDIKTGTCLHTLPHSSLITSLSISPDGQILASGGQDAIVRLWNLATQQCLNTLQGHPNGVWSVAFSPDGETLVSGSNDSMIKLWQVKTGQSIRTLLGYNDGIRTIAFDPVRQLLASGGSDKTVKLWDIRSGQCIKTLAGHSSWIWNVKFSRDGQILATVSSDQTVRLWRVDTGEPLQVLYGHTNLVMSVAFSEDDQLLVSGCSDQTVRVWDVQTGQCLNTLHCPGQVWSVDCSSMVHNLSTNRTESTAPAHSSPRQHLIASSGDDTVVRLWHIPSGRCIKTFAGHTSAVWSVAFSPNGRLLASGCHDQTIRLSDVQSGECLQVLPCKGRVSSVSFSADGQLLASGSDDKMVMLWDVQSGQCLATLSGHQGEVYATTFLGNQSVLASGGQGGLIKLWNTQTGELIKTLRDKLPYEQMNLTGTTGITAAQKVTLKALGAIEASVAA